MNEFNENFMREAIKQAKKAWAIGETPIGAVIVYDGKIIARGYNKRETKKNSLNHAEIETINKKYDGLVLQIEEMLARLTQKEGIISSLIDTLEYGLDDSSHSDDDVVSRNNGLVRRKVKEETTCRAFG